MPRYVRDARCHRSALSECVCGMWQFRSARRGMLMARSLLSSSPGHLLPTDRQLLTMPCRPCFLCPDSAQDQDAADEGQRYACRAISGLLVAQ